MNMRAIWHLSPPGVFLSLIYFTLAPLSPPCLGAGEDLAAAIHNFPRLSAIEYRPDVAVDSLNTLIRSGQSNACAALRKVAAETQGDLAVLEMDQKVCLLCRLLFLPRNTKSVLRGPRLGGSHLLPDESMKPADWPFLPYAIIDGLPISVSLGYTLQGIAEPAEKYLSYCESNGTIRLEPFPVPTTISVSNALVKLFDSPRWKSLQWESTGAGPHYKLNESYVKEMLWRQAENLRGAGG